MIYLENFLSTEERQTLKVVRGKLYIKYTDNIESILEEDLKENLNAFVSTIMKIRPASVKGDYVKNIAITSTMGPGIKISLNSFDK